MYRQPFFPISQIKNFFVFIMQLKSDQDMSEFDDYITINHELPVLTGDARSVAGLQPAPSSQ